MFFINENVVSADVSVNQLMLAMYFCNGLSNRNGNIETIQKRWIISLSKEENLKTFHQAKIDKKEESLSKEKKSETFQNMLKIFPDADLTDVRTETEDE